MKPARHGHAPFSDAPGWAPTLVTLALVAMSAALLAAAFHYPFVESRFALVLPDWIPDVLGAHDRIRGWLIAEGQIPVGEQLLSEVVGTLAAGDEWFIAVAIVLFSIVFPMLKIALAAIVLTVARKKARTRRAGLRILEFTSKWSMADVFIVGVLIVFFKAEGFHFEIEPRLGLYCFAASAITSALAVTITKWLFSVPTEQLIAAVDTGCARLADLPAELSQRPEVEILRRDLVALGEHLRE